jgi:glycosyltransferase involved in cell wall biosynthesis
MSRVAVIIPTHNRLSLLKEAVSSVQNQTLPDWELIVVDDASDDGTSAWLRDISDARVRVLSRTSHAERSSTRNEGFHASDSDLVMFLDDDDRLLPGALGYLADALTDAPVEAVVGGKIMFDERGHRKKWPHPNAPTTKDLTFDILAGWSAAPGRWLLRRSAIIETGGFDEGMSLYEDTDLWLRLAGRTPILLLPEPVLEKRVRLSLPTPKDPLGESEYFRFRFVATLEGPRHDRGLAAIAIRRLRFAAEAAVARSDFSSAFRSVLAAVRIDRETATSPLVRPYFLRTFVRSIVGLSFGSSLFDVIRRARASVRRLLKRMPGESGA